MTGNLNYVLPGKSARRPHDRQEDLIDDVPVAHDVAELDGVSRSGRRLQGSLAGGVEASVGDLRGLSSRETYDRQAALAQRRGNCCYGVVEVQWSVAARAAEN